MAAFEDDDEQPTGTESTLDDHEAAQATADAGAGTAADAAAGGKQGKEKTAIPGDDLAEMRREVERLRTTNAQLQESERFWASKAKPAGGGEDGGEDGEGGGELDDEDADDTPDKLLDDLGTAGVKALRKRGFVSQREAQRMIDEAIAKKGKQMTLDAQLYGNHPDLQDEKSELFAATRTEYQAMVRRDPMLRNSPSALIDAAEKAQLKLDVAALRGGGERGRDRGDAGADLRERDRVQRIREQQGDTGRRRGDYSGDDVLTQGQREVLAAFSRFGVTEESYKAEAKKTPIRRFRRA